jgi:hypothetical protein
VPAEDATQPINNFTAARSWFRRPGGVQASVGHDSDVAEGDGSGG